jgi:hypothetical protein
MARFFRATIFMAFFLYAGSAFAAGGTCPSGANYLNSARQLVTLASLGVTNCYYIAANGSDSNPGTSETSPWAHSPGMSTCTGNCAAITPAAGQGFIFRGGDTWNGSNLGIQWAWSGTASSPVYIGVDPGWYSGSSWARPIWSCGGAACSGGTASYFWGSTGSSRYITVDNIEVTGLFESTTLSPNYFNVCGTYMTMENIYAHGWSTNLTTTGSGSQVFSMGCGEPDTGSVLRNNVADGSDTSENMMYFSHSGAPIAYNNVMRYVQSGINGCGDIWHDNLVEYLVPGVVTVHQDGLYQYSQCYSPNSLIYNNIVRHTLFSGSGGAVKLWFNGNNACPFSSCTSYAFNNILYDNLPGNMVDTGGHYDVNYGTWYIFNNTFACGTDSTPGACEIGDNGNAQGGVAAGGTMTLYLINNHWISTGTTSIAGFGGLSGSCYHFTCSESTPVYQTVAEASAQGYNDTGTYALQPTSSSGSTVGAGTNKQSLCTAISAVDASAGAACQDDTAYACAYNASSHTVSCPTRTALARPTGAWDIGAYQFSTTTTVQTSTPKPPQGLVATVQ